GNIIESGFANVIYLFKTWQRCGVISRDAQQSVGKHPLHVADVSDDLFDGPLLRFGFEMCLCIAQGIERRVEFIDLVSESGVYIAPFCSSFDVVRVKGRVLMGSGI